MSTYEKNNLLQSKLELVSSWIRNADTKASIVLALDGAVFVYVIKLASGLLRSDGCVSFLLLLLFLGTFVSSVFFAFRTLLPDIKPISKYKLWFFGTIASMDKDAFMEQIQSISDEGISKNISEQIYINSTIANRKYHFLRLSWKLLAASGAIALIIAVVKFF